MFKDLTEVQTLCTVLINGEATQEGSESWKADIYGLIIELNGKEYVIPEKALSEELIKELKQEAEQELNNFYIYF